MPRSSIYLHLLLCFAAAVVPLACESPEPKTDDSEAREVFDSLELAPEKLVERTETLRDRSFEKPPDFEPREGPIELEPPSSLSDDVRRERELLTRMFLGKGSEASAFNTRSQLRRVADYDPTRHTVVFRRNADPPERLRAALVAALVRALDLEHFQAIPRGASWDEELGLRAADRGPGVLTAVADRLAIRTGSDLAASVERVARRPEIASELEPFAEVFELRGADAPSLHRRETSFALREGFALSAALHRASGWSAVELLHSNHPVSSGDVVRPDRWMRGDGLGTWQWSTGKAGEEEKTEDSKPNLTTESTGRLGPAVIALLLAHQVEPAAARTVYASWRSDSYRYRTSPDSDSDWRFEWGSQWKRPSGARQVAKVLEGLLKSTWGDDAVQTDVRRFGLRVMVVIQSMEGDDLASSLEEVAPVYEGRDSIPLDYVPTRNDRFEQRASRGARKDQTWSDPGARLELDLEAVSKWTFRRSQTPPLRWFARGPTGSVLQMTTELESSLPPEFGSDDYNDRKLRDYESGFAKTEEKSVDEIDGPGQKTLHFHLRGTRDEETVDMHVWQFLRGDVVVTLSLQTPGDTSQEAIEAARRVFESTETTGPPPGSKTSEVESEDSGTIEYHIEEE